MLDANLVKELHFHIGPVTIDLGTKDGRRNWGSLLAVIGFLALIFVYVTPIGQSMPQGFKDIGLTFGILLFMAGGMLVRLE